jgi:hypothetical protein
VYG